MIPAAAGLAALLAVPAARLRDRWRFQALEASDATFLLCALLIVPLMVARPFAFVGVEIPEGHVYRAYFTADYVWSRAVVAELAKGDFLPVNPYYAGDALHYYWLPHLFSAVEYRAGDRRQPRHPAADPLGAGRRDLRRRALRDSAAGRAGALGGAGRGGVGFLATSAEGVVGLWGFWGEGAPMGMVRYLNIDAVSRWTTAACRSTACSACCVPAPSRRRIHPGDARPAGRGAPAPGPRPGRLCRGRSPARSEHDHLFVRRPMFTAAAAAYEAGRSTVQRGGDGGRVQRGLRGVAAGPRRRRRNRAALRRPPGQYRPIVVRFGLNQLSTQFLDGDRDELRAVLLLGGAGLVAPCAAPRATPGRSRR